MASTYTKSQVEKLLNVAEITLYEESRIYMMRKFSASQLDRRVRRSRELRDKARDLLQRQRVALQDKTGSKRGAGGTADQQRSKDKVAVMTDILRRFEGQLKIARKREAEGHAPANAPKRHVTRKAAKTRRTAPDRDFTAQRMRSRQLDAQAAGETMRKRRALRTSTEREEVAILAPAPVKKKTAARTSSARKKASTTKTATTTAGAPASRTASASKGKKTSSVDHTSLQALPGGPTSGKRTRSVKALNHPQVSAGVGFADARSHNTAQQRKFQDALLTPIQAHISSHGRRSQGKRDNR